MFVSKEMLFILPLTGGEELMKQTENEATVIIKGNGKIIAKKAMFGSVKIIKMTNGNHNCI